MSDILTSYKKELLLLDREVLEEKISHLSEKKYNRYQWWRRYQDIQELDEKAPMIRKINNGDYDYPSYFYQAQHEVYRMYDEVKDMKPSEDKVDRINLYMERYRRLMEDSEKEENKRFNALKKRLSKELKISKEDLELVMENFEGTIEDLYLYLKNKKDEQESDLRFG
jgi:NACalpha-BTF3-like transcription factor